MLISGLEHGLDGDAGLSSVGAEGEFFDGSEWADEASTVSGMSRTLDHELAAAAHAVDEEELIMLAQRFNAVKDQLDEARLQLVDRASEQDALDHALNEQDRLQTLLENACEALQHEKASNRRLQDELDEALGPSISERPGGRDRAGTLSGPTPGGGGGGNEDSAVAAVSLEDELAAFSWETEKTNVIADLSQAKATVGALETELAAAKVANAEAEAKLAASNSDRERWQGQQFQLEAKVAKADQDALESKATHEMAQTTMKDKLAELEKQVLDLEREVQVARGVAERVREESKAKLSAAVAKHEAAANKHAAAASELEAELEASQTAAQSTEEDLAALRSSSHESISNLKAQLATATANATRERKQSKRDLTKLKNELEAKVAESERQQEQAKVNEKERATMQKKYDEAKHEKQMLKVQRDKNMASEKTSSATVTKLEARLKTLGADHVALKTKLGAAEAAQISARNATGALKKMHAQEKVTLEAEIEKVRKSLSQAELAAVAVQKELRDKITKLQLQCTESGDQKTRAEEEAVRATTERLSLMNELSEAQRLHTSTMDAESKSSEELQALRISNTQLRQTVDSLEEKIKVTQERSDSSGRELASMLTELNRAMHDNAEMSETNQALTKNCQDKDDALREAEAAVATERVQVGSLTSDLNDCNRELQNLVEMQQMVSLASEQHTETLEREQEGKRSMQIEIDRLTIELENVQQTLSEASDKLRESELSAKRRHDELDTVLAAAGQLKENILSLESENSSLLLELSGQAEEKAILAAAQQQANDLFAERTGLAGRLQDMEGRLTRTKSLLAEAASDRDLKGKECTRLMTLVEDAGRNIKEHSMAGEAAAKEIERLRAALVHAETASKRAREWVEQTEASHEKARAKIIERADREIRRQRDVIAEAKSIGTSLAEQLNALGGPINLAPVHEALVRIHKKLTTLAEAQPRRHAIGDVPTIPPLPSAEVARGQDQGTLLIGWAQSLEMMTTAVVESALAAANSAAAGPAQPPPLHDAKQELASDSVSRLLAAVKRFHSAEAAGQTLIAGMSGSPASIPPLSTSPTPTTPARPPSSGIPNSADRHEESKFSPAQMSLENIGEAPEEAMPDSLDSKALSMAQLSTEEYTELHRDWKRLKTKVQDLSTRLRSAKAAVAVGKFREETQRVYIRNRDRLVSRILLKPANKSRTIRLLQMLQDTGM